MGPVLAEILAIYPALSSLILIFLAEGLTEGALYRGGNVAEEALLAGQDEDFGRHAQSHHPVSGEAVEGFGVDLDAKLVIDLAGCSSIIASG